MGRAGRPNGNSVLLDMKLHGPNATCVSGKLYLEFKECSAVDAALALDGNNLKVLTLAQFLIHAVPTRLDDRWQEGCLEAL